MGRMKKFILKSHQPDYRVNLHYRAGVHVGQGLIPEKTLTDCVNNGKYVPTDLRNSLGALNRSNKCNSYAKEFPIIDDIQSCKYDNGPVYPCFLTGNVHEAVFGFKKAGLKLRVTMRGPRFMQSVFGLGL